MSAEFKHIPVLAKETIELLNIRPGKTYVDCTLGGGGHAENIKLQNAKSKIIGIDQDEDAIEAAKKRLSEYPDIRFIRDNFKNLKETVKEPVDGILFDLGVSSYQIDEASRGFSIQKEGPLDMRMDKSQKLTADHIINNFDEEELVEIFRDFGEERFSKRIARQIVGKRPIKTTQDLRKIIEKSIPTWKKRESVTRIFQALRIAVNNELESLRIALEDAIELLNPGGRIVVIAYHSLEDRIVKLALRQAKMDGKLTLLTKKPVRAEEDEIASNPRAKSAKLRAGLRPEQSGGEKLG